MILLGQPNRLHQLDPILKQAFLLLQPQLIPHQIAHQHQQILPIIPIPLPNTLINTSR